MKKVLVVGIIILFLLIGIYPTSAIDTLKKTIIPSNSGNTLYVGGSGPGNYTSIQDAVDNASDGDTVFVYHGYYKEHVIIEKSINLIGEDREITIIDGHGCWETILIKKENVTIKSFTIENSVWYGDMGIYVHSNNTTIIDNIIYGDTWALNFYHSHSNTIIGNIFDNTKTGIELTNSENNIIMNNSLYHCGIRCSIGHQKIVSNNIVNGKPLIYLEHESDKIISNNAGQIILVNCNNITVKKQMITEATIGLQILNSNNCSITDNDVYNNWYRGIILYHSSNNIISNNTLYSNGRGILLSQYSNNNTLLNNNMNSNEDSSIGASKSSSNTFIGNNISNSKSGISIGSGKNNIISNKITNNEKGISIDSSDYTTIDDNIILNNKIGISIGGSEYNTIVDNNISNNEKGISASSRYSNISSNTINSNDNYGIYLGSSSQYNKITHNTIKSNNNDSIHLYNSDFNEITYNEISNNDDGIYLLGSSYNTISKNNITENNDGIYLIFCIDWFYKTQSLGNTIIQNNFFRNKRHAFCGGDWSNTWVENYWSKSRYFPKLIFGKILLSEHYLIIPLIVPWINFDWHPAKEPYDIGV